MHTQSNSFKNINKTMEEGSDCWLDYRPVQMPSLLEEYSLWCGSVVSTERSPLIVSALNEMCTAFERLLGSRPSILKGPGGGKHIAVGTISGSDLIAGLAGGKGPQGEEGFIIKTVENKGASCILVAGNTEKGVLYGTYRLLRMMSLGEPVNALDISDSPGNPLRLINHWDNLDGSIERGYSGRSIFFDAGRLTGNFKRVRKYARLLASIGINGVVINNVNVRAEAVRLITPEYLPEVAQLADIFREYGIRTYLSINFASPLLLGALETADPLDDGVRTWWRGKAEEIYGQIPDFGGFLVKADSEYTPGPFTYGRNHVEGANMLAEALAPFDGLVMWRCFVYNCRQDWRDRRTDRAKAAYDNFKPLDGRFMENVVLQIKNGPMDFQVREPVSPLFGGLECTSQMLELQITQEYTGQQRHLCYLIPQWTEALDFDTHARGNGSYVKRIADGSLFGRKHCGFAGVSNIGNDFNWTGHDLAQSNLYGFGRLAWSPELSSDEIAEEWIRLTFTNNIEAAAAVREMLMDSWRIYESYTSPLGIGWMVNPNHHYGPNVDGYEYSMWGTYHYADCSGLGVDRTSKSGTGYTAQYFHPNASMYESADTCPEELLLFFHHLPYTHRLKSGKTIIQHIYDTHFQGAEQAGELITKWTGLKGIIDDRRYEAVLKRLKEQSEHAREWRDVINSYFFRKTGIVDERGRKIY